MIRELCRGFGRYRRYLGRLRQNLRETQKFFRDIKGSHSHSCPSSPAGGGAAELGPAGDVAEAPLPAGKDRPEAERKSGGWHPRQKNNPRRRRPVGEGGPRGGAGPGPRGSEMRWEDTPRGESGRGSRDPEAESEKAKAESGKVALNWGAWFGDRALPVRH